MSWRTQSPCEWLASDLNTCPAGSDLGLPQVQGGCLPPVSLRPPPSRPGWPHSLLLLSTATQEPCVKGCFLAWESPESLYPSVPCLSEEPLGIHTQKEDVALSLWNSGSGKWCCSFLKPSSIPSTPRVDRIYLGSSDRSAYAKWHTGAQN